MSTMILTVSLRLLMKLAQDGNFGRWLNVYVIPYIYQYWLFPYIQSKQRTHHRYAMDIPTWLSRNTVRNWKVIKHAATLVRSIACKQ